MDTDAHARGQGRDGWAAPTCIRWAAYVALPVLVAAYTVLRATVDPHPWVTLGTGGFLTGAFALLVRVEVLSRHRPRPNVPHEICPPKNIGSRPAGPYHHP